MSLRFVMSTSPTLTPVMLNGASSRTVCAAGTVITGASLTSVTVMFTVSVSADSELLATLPPSKATVVTTPWVPTEVSHRR